jgi:coiled-coil domain-containing protein 55
MHAAALAEDPSVFDYDAHYDDIQRSRVEPKRQEKVARESKYIGSLLEKAEERKREQDVLMERRLAKERAAEDHLFGDKEKFVTAAYRRKMEEDRKWKEEQKKK